MPFVDVRKKLSGVVMRQSTLLAFCVCLSATLPTQGQRSEDWLPVTAQDLQIQAVPGDPKASAVLLYYADFKDDTKNSEFLYKRVKILNQEGRKYANSEIPVPANCDVRGLEARTIGGDGKEAQFVPQLVERPSHRETSERVAAFAFANPAPGQILEYKYRLACSQDFRDSAWSVQHDLYTVKERFWLRPYTGAHKGGPEDQQVSYVNSNMPLDVEPRHTNDGIEMELQNVAAFKTEAYMPPEKNFKAEVRFFYGGHEIESPETFWRQAGKEWYGTAENFIGNHQEIKAAVGEIISTETDSEKKVRKLYARAQQIRNLSYQANSKPGLLETNRSVVDVLTRGYGEADEIAELFTALARAAGFETDLLRASSRQDRVFDYKLLARNQLSSEIVRVKLNGSELFLDPGTRFCTFGLVAWNKTSVLALKLEATGGSFLVVPTATADKNVTRRTAEVMLAADGSLKGTVILQFKGNEALRRRLVAVDEDDSTRRERLQQELREWLPASSTVQLRDVQDWNDADEQLLARFTVEIPRVSSTSGDRFRIPANLFRSRQSEAFRSAERKYPVYFPYTFEEIDSVTVKVAAGYVAETVPNGQDVKLASTRFITTRSAKETMIMETRALVVNSIYFQPEQYPELKTFFDKLQQADTDQVVVRKVSN